MNKSTQIGIYDDQHALSHDLMRYIYELAILSTNARQQFCVALSGGSLVDTLTIALEGNLSKDPVDWSTWQVFLVDERWVSRQNPESNYGSACKRFLNRLPIPDKHIHAMDTSKRVFRNRMMPKTPKEPIDE